MFAAARRLLVRATYVVAVGVATLSWAGDSPRSATRGPAPFEGPATDRIPTGDTLRVATWNLARARGPWWDHGHDSPHRVQVRLASVAASARAMGADVLAVQEADIRSSRSADIDQPRWLAREAGYAWTASAPSWDLGYLPWPITRPSDHVGRVKMGHAVLSDHPIVAHEYIPLPQPTEYSALRRHFWVHRAIERVTIDFHGTQVHVLNAHLESRSGANRDRHMELLAAEAKALDGPVVILGDLNTLPHDAPRRAGFPDHADFRTDRSMAWLRRALPGYREAFDGTNDDPATLTFPTQDPQRRLDFVLYSHHFASSRCEVFRPFAGQLAAQPSDHFPVACALKLGEATASRGRD